jgi:predicted choloylglycine hydrolase
MKVMDPLGGGLYHPRVKGSYYEMGFHYGTRLRRHGFKLPPQDPKAVEFGRRSEPEVRRVFPQIIDEFQGFADACGAEYESLLGFMLVIGTRSSAPKCSAFGVSSDSGVVFGRNYDFFYEYKKYTESYLTVPADGFASVGQSDVFIGREDGVNEKGLAIAIAAVGPKTVKPGINFPIAVRYILDQCSDVKDALKTLSRFRFSTTNNYLLADRLGALAVLEASPERKAVRHPERGDEFILCTNHFIGPDVSASEDSTQRDSDSVQRYDSIHMGIRQRNRKFDARAAKVILSNNVGAVCSHRDEIKLGTLWSLVSDLSTGEVFRAEGQPCRISYQEDLHLKRFLFTLKKTG